METDFFELIDWLGVFVWTVGIFADLSLVFGAYITGLMIFDLVFKWRDESKD